jgi:hypothetical protein
VAIINDDVILQSELNEALQSARKLDNGADKKMILNELINSTLLLEQAKKFRLGNSDARYINMDDRKLVDEYIEKRLKALIHIPFRDIEYYYMYNLEKYNNKDIYEVKDEIENYLIEMELEKKLFEHIDELREKAYIRIQIETEE